MLWNKIAQPSELHIRKHVSADMHALIAMSGLLLASSLQGSKAPNQGGLAVGSDVPKMSLLALEGKAKLELGGKRERPLVLIFGSCT